MSWFEKESRKECDDRIEHQFKIRFPIIAAYCDKKGLSYRPNEHRLYDLLAEIIKDLESKI